MLDHAATIITALAAVGAVIVSWLNNRKLQSVHIDLNSRLTQLLAANAHAARSEGIEQGQKDQKAEGAAK
jgi:hypothetical protein